MTVAMLLAYRMRSRVSLNWQGLIISRLLLVILLWRGLLRGRSPRLAGFGVWLGKSGESILIEGTVVSHSDLCDPRALLSWRRVGSVGEPFKNGGEQVGR